MERHQKVCFVMAPLLDTQGTVNWLRALLLFLGYTRKMESKVWKSHGVETLPERVKAAGVTVSRSQSGPCQQVPRPAHLMQQGTIWSGTTVEIRQLHAY